MMRQDDLSSADAQQVNRRDILNAAAFLAAAGTAAALAHVGGVRRAYADVAPLGNLEEQVPHHFDGWAAQGTAARLIVDPTVEQSVAEAYDAILARKYVGPEGSVVELVLAYVRQVTDSHRVHDPETCYPAQGYSITNRHVVQRHLMNRDVPTTVFSVSDVREEAQRVHYWIVEGPNIASSNFQRKLKRLDLGLSRLTPDGMLVRLSTRQTNPNDADTLLSTFTAALVHRMPAPLATKLLGPKHATD